MKYSMIEIEDEVLTFDVSDDALEVAAGSKEASNYTLGACTGLGVCPS